MNKHEQPMGVDPKIKKEINEEGFEGDAAVLIGKKEDMPRMLEKLETEGKTEDLGTYIKLHKEIVLPIDSPVFLENPLQRDSMKEITGEGFLTQINHNNSILHYIDKDGNYCVVEINPQKIAQLAQLKNGCVSDHMLTQLGFNVREDNIFRSNLGLFMEYAKKHKSNLEDEAKKAKKATFDF